MVIKFLKHLFGLSSPAPYIRDFLTSDGTEELPEGIFISGETGDIAIEFLWHGREISRGQLVLLSLEGMEDLQLDSPQLIEEILRRISSKRTSLQPASLGYLAIADLTEGARFGSWGIRFPDDRVQGIQTFKLPPRARFCFLLVSNTHLNEIDKNSLHVKGDRFCFSFLPHRFVDVTGEGNIFAFGQKGGLYNSPVFRIWEARGNAPSLDRAIAPDLDWRKTLLGEELLCHIKDIPPLVLHPSIVPKTTERARAKKQQTEAIILGQSSISQAIAPQPDLIPSILAEYLKQFGIYDLIENEGTSIARF